MRPLAQLRLPEAVSIVQLLRYSTRMLSAFRWHTIGPSELQLDFKLKLKRASTAPAVHVLYVPSPIVMLIRDANLVGSTLPHEHSQYLECRSEPYN